MADLKTMLAFHERTTYDALNMLLGQELGRGMSRQVFVNDLNHHQAVKVEQSTTSYQNVLEWEMWKCLVETDSPLKPWFAPCRFMSPDNRILIQDRTEQPLHYPAWVPKVFSDLKLTNFGTLPDGRFVCHDYGMTSWEHGITQLRFVQAKWWRQNGLAEFA